MEFSRKRQHLINLCERAIVHESEWKNRDTSAAIINIGKLWALLKAGCEFKITDESSSKTYWVEMKYKGFRYFEMFGSDPEKEEEVFYVPTENRIKEVDKDDWY